VIAKGLHRLGDASDCNSGEPRRIVWATIVTSRMLGGLLVHAQLLFQVAVAPPWVERSP
jgi:hypothetical protein